MDSASILRNPIGFLLLPQFALIAFSAAIEPLRIANRYLQKKYEWRLLSIDGKPVPDNNNIHINVESDIAECGALGTLIICADIRPQRFKSSRLTQWLQALDRNKTILGGVDTGGYVLAEAGLLDGQNISVHWEILDTFQESFPRNTVLPTLFNIEGRRFSCAGGLAVIDLMLNSIASDHGILVANRVAEHCFHERIREGATWQRMALPMRSGVYHPILLKALQLLEERTDQVISLKELSEELKISVRQLIRIFRRHVKTSPYRYHLHLRLERAWALLLQTDLSITQIGIACGFESGTHFARAFRSQFGKSPSILRESMTVNEVKLQRPLP